MSLAVEIPVDDEDGYLGMFAIEALADFPRTEWPNHLVAEVADADWPVARLSWTLERAVRTMEDCAVETLPVLDPDDRFVGVTAIADILRLDEILQSTETEGEVEPT